MELHHHCSRKIKGSINIGRCLEDCKLCIEKRSCFLLEKKWRWSCCFAEIVMKNLPINQFVKNYFCTLCYSSVDKNCVCSKKDGAFFQKTSP